MFKKVLMGSLAAATMTASAYAADLPARAAPPPPPPVPVCVWCGVYVGVNGGGAWMTRNGWGSNNGGNDVFVETVGAGGVIFPVSAGVINNGGNGNGNGFGFFNNGNNNNNQGGGFGGGQIGINWQWGMFVAGGELDFQGSRVNANGVGVAGNIFGGLTTIATTERLDYFGTARARVGLAFGGPGWNWGWGPAGFGGSVLVYATGGFAYAGMREGFASVLNVPGVAAGAGAAVIPGAAITLASANIGNNGRTGFAAGGGVEWKFLPNWSVKGEYQFIGLRQGPLASATEIVATGPAILVGAPTTFVMTHRNPSFGIHTARIGLNYHFTLAPPAPVVAKY